jgi:hypothetical protein
MFRRFRFAVIVGSATLAVVGAVSGSASGADRPVTGDWDGNNTTTIGVARPDPESNNWIWGLSNKNVGGSVDSEFLYGNKNIDRVVTGDWDGNNTTTIGIVRPEAGNWHWYLRNSNSGGTSSADFLFGSAG